MSHNCNKSSMHECGIGYHFLAAVMSKRARSVASFRLRQILAALLAATIVSRGPCAGLAIAASRWAPAGIGLPRRRSPHEEIRRWPFVNLHWRVARWPVPMQPRRYKIRGPPKAQSALAARFSDFQAYCFASGSAPKFAWTIVHLSPFFTKTRVDFARCGVVFPSLSWVRPT